jgi:hypothetical protein
MQMNASTIGNVDRRKVIVAFLVSSVFTGGMFAFFVTIPALRTYWFRTEEIWTFPTAKLWLLTITLFFLNLLIPSFVAMYKHWLLFSAVRVVLSLMLVAIVPLLGWVLRPHSALSQLLLFRAVLALCAAFSSWLITQRWHWMIAVIMLILSLATPLIAGIIIPVRHVPLPWLEAIKFFVNSALLAVTFGWWLVNDKRRKLFVAPFDAGHADQDSPSKP